ncbi:MAG TPA: UDP-N-acetylmuramoyl-L-alanyl-D-glutamate--2,6-diaminopimelate ligase [Afifellaceae bacterium]|nr:UDP-N-acetylmuramoyl-L-alanyl-D-glutamate--2,6-diaminopimelate ligase [Afifellaceae bacterium]
MAEIIAEDAELPEGAGDLALTGLTADSRRVAPGMLFAALPGTKVDGARFVPQAVAAGAAAILTGPQPIEHDPGVPVIRAADPHRALARAAARFYGAQPGTIVAVTGTNGKTSVAVFVRQLWQRAGRSAASLGTIGLVAPGGARPGNLTTPDPVALHALLAELAGEGVSHLALEASSHGLEQRRLDGVHISAAAFTNLSRDHLDYHPSLDAYFAAKRRLFEDLLPEGAGVVIDPAEPYAEGIAEVARRRDLPLLTVGSQGETLRLLAADRTPDGARLTVEAAGERFEVPLPLVGRFQTSNALVAAGLAIATGMKPAEALAGLEHLKGASGRLERVGTHPSGAQVYVDYAHTPEALANVLQALRPHVQGRLTVVFGAGGDRDPGKRPLMGEAAHRHADRLIVTDDNPRSEDPSLIRRAILEGAPGAEEIGDRRAAIGAAVAGLGPGDILLIAGKGHETGQTIGDTVLPFSDQEEARAALAALEAEA